MNNVLKAIAGISDETAFTVGVEGIKKYRLPPPAQLESSNDVFEHPVKNFGRFPKHVKAACVACALAMKAAGRGYSKGEKNDTALLTAGYEPTLNINESFFRDYLDGGRTMGRGNLFIYSLPTSAASEVSIHFGLTGPALYLETDNAPLKQLVEAAEQITSGGDAGEAVLLWQNSRRSLCALTEQSRQGGVQGVSLQELKKRAAQWQNIEDAFTGLEDL